MDTNRLRQFCTIAETGSIAKASAILHITHSGLSKSMKFLQEELNCILFRPSGRGLALTEQGIQIYKRSKEFLDHEQRLFKIENTLPEVTAFRIGTVEIFLASIVELLKKEPIKNNVITLLDLEPGHIEQSIANRQLDFGITYVPYPIENIEITEIGEYTLGCYYLQGAFEKYLFSDIPFVVPAQDLVTNALGIKERDGWPDSIYPRNKIFKVNLLSTAIELTLQGLCAIYIPDFYAKKINFSCRENKILVEFPLPKIQKQLQSMFILRHYDQSNDDMYKQLFHMMEKLISE